MGFASLAMLAACSDDAPVMDGGVDVTPSGEGSTAYLNVTIRDANDIYGRSSRAEANEEYGFEDASGHEGEVNTARFYFFGENGSYMGQSTVWNGGSTDTNDANIEFKSPTLVVLENVKDADKETGTYPTYMITVLNGAQFTNEMLQGYTIDRFSQELVNWGTNTENGFVMTTTSFYDEEGVTAADHTNTYYYATKIDKSKFARSAELAMQNPAIQVYVERLAARVKLISDEYIPVKATIWGADGDNPEVTPAPGDNENTEAATPLYVRIDGWYINGVQEQSYLNKQLGSDWTSTTFDGAKYAGKWLWNLPSLHRSYWGMSHHYGEITATEAGDAATDLKFFPYANENVMKVNGVAYCNENTSTYDNLKISDANPQPNQRKLTSVIIKATLGTGGNTESTFEPLSFVEHNGFYYTDERFIAYVLGVANANVCIKTVDESDTQIDTHYTPIAVKDNYAIDGNNARVYVKTAYGNDIDTSNLWIKNASTGKWEQTTVEAIDAKLKAATASSRETRRATGGAMYYNVPIAHLNTAKYDENGDLESWKEGTFGVVRNHAYEVNIRSVKRLGTGVFDPEGDNDTEPIKPTEDPKDPNWFLGAEINILSWKIVNNYVDL